MDSHREVEDTLQATLVAMGLGAGDGVTLPGPDQMLTNALGISLALRWARRVAGARAGRRVHLCVPVHQNDRTSHLAGVPVADLSWIPKGNRHDYSFLLDVFLEEWSGERGKGAEAALLGAEIEAYPNHGVEDDVRRNDYQWDFYKLVYATVPRRLFVACTRAERLPALESSISKAWNRTRGSVPKPNDRLAVLLLPAGTTQWASTRIGTARGGGELTFGSVQR